MWAMNPFHKPSRSDGDEVEHFRHFIDRDFLFPYSVGCRTKHRPSYSNERRSGSTLAKSLAASSSSFTASID